MTADSATRCTDEARASLEHVLRQILCRGFYGTANLELIVENGVIQQANDRIERKRRLSRQVK